MATDEHGVLTDDAIVFRTEDSLWQMLKDGRKRWDARQNDLTDDRIYKLHWMRAVKTVSFLNKATGKLLTFEYKGMEFAPWAPGWCFLILGKAIPGQGT